MYLHSCSNPYGFFFFFDKRKIREFLRESQIEWMDEVRMRYEELKTLWNYVCEIDSFKISCIDLFEKLYESGVLQQEIIEKQQVLHNILHNKKCLQGIENNVDNINGFVDIAKIFKTILEKLIKK